MPLPTSKTALDRLGVRLSASDPVSEDDLVALAQVVDAYQDVLNDAKRKLSDLGFSATTRMKTTGTLVEKLRRETARLSQVQDLAGARITVPDRLAQDDATSQITAAFEAAGCPCKVIDRRESPSYGYRAVHVVTQVDKVPVEIQVRTDLQDSWAQLLERLADVWGRGIRYGEEPEAPDTQLGGDEPLGSRRDVISLLMQVSDLSAKVEKRIATYTNAARNAEKLAAVAEVLAKAKATGDVVIGDTLPEDWLSRMDQWIAAMPTPEPASYFVEWRRMTIVQFGEALRRTYELAQPTIDRVTAELPVLERDLRGILTRLADAIGEG